jgi:hypothetical protein
MVTPPIGWKPDPLKITDKSKHRVWLSPTGATAYGVIYFNLPLPVGANLALMGFLDQMKRTTGEAIVISQTEDDQLPGYRFIADGGHYRIRCNLMTRGFHGWAVYAGSLRARPVNPDEVRVAEQARELTKIGLK